MLSNILSQGIFGSVVAIVVLGGTVLVEPRVDGAGVVRLEPEETSVVLMLEVCAGEAAELLCARLGVSSGKTVLAEKVSGVVLSPGKPGESAPPGAGVSVVRSALLLSVWVSAPLAEEVCESGCGGVSVDEKPGIRVASEESSPLSEMLGSENAVL